MTNSFVMRLSLPRLKRFSVSDSLVEEVGTFNYVDLKGPTQRSIFWTGPLVNWTVRRRN